jgi:hypothetical protein
MPKKSLPKKGTAEYNEQIADDPSDFIDDSEEEEAGQNITPKPAKKTTTKTKNSSEKTAQKVAEEEKLQAIYATAAAALPPEQQKAFWDSLKPKETTTRVKYDHDTTLNNLIDDTEDAVALMKKLKDDYEAVFYMGLLCEYWKTLHKLTDPANRAKKNAHDAFIKHFKKHQHFYGLPPATPAGSKTSSRAASVAPEEGEEVEEMEEIEEEEEEVEETK